MKKYYTRACNFYYGSLSKQKIKKKLSLPVNGSHIISFDSIELITRKTKKIIHIKKIDSLPKKIKEKVILDIKNITKKKVFSKLNFNNTPLLMGILNVTPDSFSDGGKFLNNNLAQKQINKLIKDGANIIDIGGESTRPGSKEISEFNEWKRIKSKLNFLKKKRCFVSLDTRKSIILEKSLSYNINLLNDVSGLNYDSKMIDFLKKYKVPFVVHHMKGIPKNMQLRPSYKNVLLDIYDYFERNVKKLDNKKIILDPGIGFGKTLKHNLSLISKISLFHSLGFPILVGTSRKRFISQISGKNDSKDRTGGTIASILYLLSQGVQIFRVHNVNEVQQAILVFKKILSN